MATVVLGSTLFASFLVEILKLAAGNSVGLAIKANYPADEFSSKTIKSSAVVEIVIKVIGSEYT